MISTSMDALVWLGKQLETDDNDLLREMVRRFAEELMSADADVACNAGPGYAVNRTSAVISVRQRHSPQLQHGPTRPCGQRNHSE